MKALRTPDERFTNLPDYPFAPHYVDVDGLRMHYVDEGDPAAAPVLMLHGEPTWSFLYRKMIPVFKEAGMRAVAPDLIGFGKSDKLPSIEDYSYQRHVDWLVAFIQALDLRNITLVCQDWGSLLGLRIAAEHESRFSRLVIANGFLPIGDQRVPRAFKLWRLFARYSPVLPIGRIVGFGCHSPLDARVIAAYDAPYPSAAYQAGARAFPRLVPTDPANPAVPANRAAWAKLGEWRKPCLTVFGTKDPIFGRADKRLHDHIPGTAGHPHARVLAGHFIQEDQGKDLAARAVDFIRRT